MQRVLPAWYIMLPGPVHGCSIARVTIAGSLRLAQATWMWSQLLPGCPHAPRQVALLAELQHVAAHVLLVTSPTSSWALQALVHTPWHATQSGDSLSSLATEP
jgi:hypothetical protein